MASNEILKYGGPNIQREIAILFEKIIDTKIMDCRNEKYL